MGYRGAGCPAAARATETTTRPPTADLAAARRRDANGKDRRAAPMTRLDPRERPTAGKVALVTGAASGMGRATAHLFADEGARVAVIDRDADGARRVAQEIASVGGHAHAWDLDVSDETRIAATVAGVVDRYGGIDILIN